MKNHLLCFFILILAGFSFGSEKPNILLILADDLGFSDLGCYGGEIATPHLDSISESGIRYTQMYNTARCWPTRGSLLTGFYAQQIRRDKVPSVPMSGNRGKRQEWAELLPKRLATAGYRSYHTGKWHIDGMPLEQGFDRSFYLRDQGRFFNPIKLWKDDVPLPPVEEGTGFYATTALADHAIEVLKEHASDYPDRPFFHYLAFTAPHFPLHALPEDIAIYDEIYTKGWDVIRARRWSKMNQLGLLDRESTPDLSLPERNLGPPYHFPEVLEILGAGEINKPVPWAGLTAEQKAFQAKKMAIHAAMIHRMDIEIGRVFEQIQKMGEWDNTLVIFLSDNGASAEIMVRDDGHDPSLPAGSAGTYLCLGPGWSTVSNTPFRRHKTWTHEGGISTPFLVSWPAQINTQGEIRRTPGHVIDLVPTLFELTGAEFHPEAPPPPGRSLVPSFYADTDNPHKAIWWFHDGHKAIRMGDWKAVQPKGEQWELYDLSKDRIESTDLANEYPEKLTELIKEWDRRMEECASIATGESVKRVPEGPQIRIIPLASPLKTEDGYAQWMHPEYNAQDILEMIDGLKPQVLERYFTGKQDMDAFVPVREGNSPMTVKQFLNASMQAGAPGCIIIPKLNLTWFSWGKGKYFWEAAENNYNLDIERPIRIINLDNWRAFIDKHGEDKLKDILIRLKQIGFETIGVNMTGGYRPRFGMVSFADFPINSENWTIRTSTLDKFKADPDINQYYLYIDYPGQMDKFMELSPDKQADVLTSVIEPAASELDFTFVYPILFDRWDATKHITKTNGPYKGVSIFDVIKQSINPDVKQDAAISLVKVHQ